MTSPLTPIVLDSSVALAIALGEPQSAVLRSRVQRWIEIGEQFIVPSHFWLEVVNVLGRTHRLPGKFVMEALYHLDDLGMTTVEIDRMQLVLTIGRVEQYGLTAYDAAYLALAHSSSAKLATLDRRLATAAGAHFVDPLGEPGHRTSEEPAIYESEGSWPEFREASAFLARIRSQARPRRV
ncbi:MAG TPA: type II toxin-antitoxin system VapC family toxin [Vitreimonas sp.]|nr:type II toxin-antitoxin system VapC family toxin [Vitreimonas sp.]